MKHVYKIVTDRASSTPPTLWLPSTCPSKSSAVVRVGQHSEPCKVVTHEHDFILYVTNTTYCYMLNGARLYVKSEPGSIRLGPLVGILVSKGTINSIVRGEPKFRLVELARVNEWTPALPYYFSIGDVDMARRLINGWFYHIDSGRWMQGTFPFPDVFWDRGGGFLKKQLPAVQKIRQQLYGAQLTTLNAVYHFSKWEIHKRLSNHSLVRPYLPETIQYRTSTDVLNMLKKYGTIYIKDIFGSNGREVLRVEQVPDGYHYSAFNERLISGNATTFPHLIKTIEEFFGESRLIVQQGIHALTAEGRKVDFRALVQRDTAGHWRLTSIPMRVAGENSPITSTASGSKVWRVWQGLVEVLGFSEDEALTIYGELVAALWRIVPAIEQEYGKFGELGIDLCADKSGKIWFFECNSKPGKDTVILAGVKSEIDLAFARPLQYAGHLAGFGSDQL